MAMVISRDILYMYVDFVTAGLYKCLWHVSFLGISFLTIPRLTLSHAALVALVLPSMCTRTRTFTRTQGSLSTFMQTQYSCVSARKGASGWLVAGAGGRRGGHPGQAKLAIPYPVGECSSMYRVQTILVKSLNGPDLPLPLLRGQASRSRYTRFVTWLLGLTTITCGTIPNLKTTRS